MGPPSRTGIDGWRTGRARKPHAGLAQQARYAQDVLNALPHRRSFEHRLQARQAATPQLSALRLAAGRVFYLRRDPGDPVARLILQPTREAPERMLLEFQTTATPHHTTIDWCVPSPDGRWVAFGVSEDGSEDSQLCLLDVERGGITAFGIPGVMWGEALTWLPDTSGFVYHRLAPVPDGASPTDKYRDSSMFLLWSYRGTPRRHT